MLGVTVESLTDEDIDGLLNEASHNAAYTAGFEEGCKKGFERGREAGFDEGFALGRETERERAYYSQFTSRLKTLIPYAEAFYRLVVECVGAESILQHRIGTDHATGVPTVLSVISVKSEGKLEELQEIMCRMAQYAYATKGFECLFWAITDHSLDKTSIGHDFPYYRTN